MFDIGVVVCTVCCCVMCVLCWFGMCDCVVMHVVLLSVCCCVLVCLVMRPLVLYAFFVFLNSLVLFCFLMYVCVLFVMLSVVVLL